LKFFTKLPVLFFGGNGAKVQMHFDIDLADILLCHFGGKKRVYLFAPEQKKYLYHVPYSFSALFDIDIEHPDYEKFPALQYLEGFVTELNHGDALYIPPGYWHYIVYEEISFSLSLRAFPRQPKALMTMFYNIIVIRNVEGLMRKLVGQAWNDRIWLMN
jgi:ribosomal protein L16 Arg81 hydroxylase